MPCQALVFTQSVVHFKLSVHHLSNSVHLKLQAAVQPACALHSKLCMSLQSFDSQVMQNICTACMRNWVCLLSLLHLLCMHTAI